MEKYKLLLLSVAFVRPSWHLTVKVSVWTVHKEIMAIFGVANEMSGCSDFIGFLTIKGSWLVMCSLFVCNSHRLHTFDLQTTRDSSTDRFSLIHLIQH